MDNCDRSLSAQGFYNQAQSIWVRHPKPSSPNSSISSGKSARQKSLSMIILFTWTSALPRPISKYAADYVEMFPDIPIMIITTTLADLTFRSERHKQSILAPAVDYLISRHLDVNVHLHCFSEGGSHKAIQFAKAYLSTTGNRISITSLCLDSTPGDHQYHRMARAFKLSLPPIWFLRFVGLIFAYLLLTFFWGFYAIYGPKKNLMTRIRRGIEDQNLWDTQHIPRCYLYSKSDALIKYEDVERHARKAERKGVPVLLARFEQSAHCHHVREDKDKYWSGVRWTLQRHSASNGGIDALAVEVGKEKEKEKDQECSAPKSTPAPMAMTHELQLPESVHQRGS
jgi:Eukaryotic protein of unknown function (DUF829)